MDAKLSSPSSFPTAGGGGAEGQHPQRPPCAHCRSTDTRFCYFAGEGNTQPKHFCLSCTRFWVEQETSNPAAAPHTTAAFGCGDAAATHVGAPTERRRRRRRRREHEAARPLLPCPRCGSSETRFLKYISKGRTRPQHFCFSCGRCWLVGSSRKGWSTCATSPPALVARPRCPRCDSPWTRSNGFRGVDRARQLRQKCLQCSMSWVRDVDGWTEKVTRPAADAVPELDSPSCSASPPVAEASPRRKSGVGCGGLQIAPNDTSNDVACSAAAAQGNAAGASTTKMAAAGSAAVLLKPSMDLDGKPREEMEMTWEDVEWIDCVVGHHMHQMFVAAYFPPENSEREI